MLLKRMGFVPVLAFIMLIILFSTTGSCQENLPVFNMTVEISETGALHYTVVQTLPPDRDGVTTAHFELQKQFRPENISVYNYETGKPLEYTVKDLNSALGYDVVFDRPYFNGYAFVVEYDNHNRIIDEGKGIYSIGFRPGVNIKKVERISTVILPPKNFTYLDYNRALDKPVWVKEIDGKPTVRFRNISSAPADYAWEIKFRAVGVKDEVMTPKSGAPVSVPGMTALISIITLIAAVRLSKR